MKIAGYEVHPAAELFSLIEGADFESLVESIKANGLREPSSYWMGSSSMVATGGELATPRGSSRRRSRSWGAILGTTSGTRTPSDAT